MAGAQINSRAPLTDLSQYAISPGLLVTGPGAMQNTPLLPPAVAEAVASTHCAYTRRDGRLSGLENTGMV